MLASEATRCTPEEWGDHPENPRRGLSRNTVYGARGHACGPRQSTLASGCEGGGIEPGTAEDMEGPAESGGGKSWEGD